jgi:hypothetical protein
MRSNARHDLLLIGVQQMKHFLTLAVTAACMVVATNLHAQSATDAATAGRTQQAPQEQRVPPVKQEARQPAKPAATFTPSERIGADSAISFPVDI